MESLIEKLRKAARESFVYSDLLREAADAITELVHSCDVLDEQVTALYGALPKWIPVTERLPEEDCKILAACSTLHYQRICRFAKNLTEIDKFVFDGKQGFYDYDSERGYYEVGWVTHWMPLPESPKDGET